MPRYDIQAMTAEDPALPDALALVWEVFSDYEAPEYAQEGVDEFKSYIALPEIQEMVRKEELALWGCFDGDRVIGFLAIRPPNHVSLLFVDEEYHRHGIARSLFETGAAYCRISHHCREITVNSSPYAQEAYRRLGFSPQGSERAERGIRYTPMVYLYPD